MLATERQRVLVIDDEEQRRNDYRRALASEFEVGVVDGAAQAIKRLKSGEFDLIITDETVAEMDGFALLVRLRELELRMPVILLTAALDNHEVLRAREYDALCLAKPINAKTLVAAVRLRMRSLTAKRSALPASKALEIVTATYAKKEFRRVLETAMKRGRVLITKYKDPRAVLMSFDEYKRLTGAKKPALEELSAEFDELVAKMQTPEARAGAAALFSISSDELGKAALDGQEA